MSRANWEGARRVGDAGARRTYLSARVDAGVLPPVPGVSVAARFIVETVAWFAMHRRGDPDSAMRRSLCKQYAATA